MRISDWSSDVCSSDLARAVSIASRSAPRPAAASRRGTSPPQQKSSLCSRNTSVAPGSVAAISPTVRVEKEGRVAASVTAGSWSVRKSVDVDMMPAAAAPVFAPAQLPATGSLCGLGFVGQRGEALGVVVRVAEQMIDHHQPLGVVRRSEEHTPELQSLMRIPYAVFCLKKKI